MVAVVVVTVDCWYRMHAKMTCAGVRAHFGERGGLSRTLSALLFVSTSVLRVLGERAERARRDVLGKAERRNSLAHVARRRRDVAEHEAL